MPCAPLPVTRCPPGARPGPVLLPACALVVFLNHSPSLGLACSEPPLASHCHQVKDKRLSLVFKALHSLCLPTAPLSFFPIHPPSVSVLPAARSSPYRPHLCGPKSSHRLRPSSNAATTLSVKQSRTWHGSQCAPAQPHGVCALIAPSCLQPMGSGAHSGSSSGVPFLPGQPSGVGGCLRYQCPEQAGVGAEEAAAAPLPGSRW